MRRTLKNGRIELRYRYSCISLCVGHCVEKGSISITYRTYRYVLVPYVRYHEKQEDASKKMA